MVLADTGGTISLFPGYTIAQEVYRGRRRIVYRASRDRDGARVIVKTLLDGSTSSEALAREYELLRSLDLDGVPRAIDLVRNGDRVALVLEDEGLTRLKTLIPAGGMDLATFFRLGVQLADVVQGLHHRRVIHKDINPNNILVDPQTGRLTLIDFSIASRVPAEHQELRHPNVLEGTLAYMSPEQTGRMNRDIDYRTDFYSLGVTFYEMLTGRLPFESADPLEVIHGHIARTPPSPRDLRPEIPPPLSDIVMKLLAKAAEERYQSARPAQGGPLPVAAEWDAGRELSPFAPGRSDIGDRFLVPQRLYGRERQLAQLMAAFEQVGDGPSQLMLVSGYSGVGKTALIRELYRPLVGRRGYFIAGKFDQVVARSLRRPAPGVSRAGPAAADRERGAGGALAGRLAGALGTGAAVLAEVVPEVELDRRDAAARAGAGSRRDAEPLPAGVPELSRAPWPGPSTRW